MKILFGNSSRVITLLIFFCLVTQPAPTRAEPDTEPVSPSAADRTEEITRLIEQLGDLDWTQREAATEKLSGIGSPALPALKQALKHSDPEIKMRAMLLIRLIRWQISPELRAQIGHLMTGYETAPTKERQQIVRQLLNHQKLALPVLLKILEYEKNDQVCSQVYTSLLKFLNDAKVVRQGLRLLKNASGFWTERLRGRLYDAQGNYPTALSHYEKALKLKPSATFMITIIQSLYERTRNWTGAIKFYRELIVSKPEVPEYRITLGRFYQYQGQPNQAQTTWQNALELKTFQENHYHQLATIYYERSKNDEAVNVYQQATARFPENNELKLHLAISHKKAKNFNEARRLLDSLIMEQVDKNFMVEALKEKGECYLLNNEPVKARATWWQIIDSKVIANPNISEYRFLGRIFETHQMTDQQLAVYTKTRRRWPKDTSILKPLARANVATGHLPDALEIVLENYIRPDQSNRTAVASFFILNCLAKTDLNATAANLIKEKLGQIPVKIKQTRYNLLLLLGEVYLISAQPDQIRSTLEEALKIGESFKDSKTFYPLARLARSADLYDLALKIYQRAEELAKNSQVEQMEIQRLTGICYFEKGDAKKAREIWAGFEQSLKPDSRHEPWRTLLKEQTKTLLKYNCSEILRPTYERILNNNTIPKSTRHDLYRDYGQVLAAAGQAELALEYYLNAKLLDPNRETDKVDDAIISLVLNTDTWSETVTKVKGHISLVAEKVQPEQLTKTTTLRITLSRLYQLAGQYEETSHALEAILKTSPDDQKILIQLNGSYRAAGKYQASLKTCDRLTKLDSANIKTLYLKAITYDRMNKPVEKETVLKEIANATQGFTENGHFQLADYLTRINQPDWAEREWHQILKKAPFGSVVDCNAYGQLAETALNREDYEAALKYTRRERPIILPDNIILFADLKTFFSRESSYIFETREKIPLFNAALLHIDAKKHQQDQQFKKAAEKYQAASRTLPTEVDVLEEMSNLANQEKISEADLKPLARRLVNYYKIKIRNYPHEPYYQLRLAETYLVRNQDQDPVAARKLIDQAIRLSPALSDNYILKAKYYHQTKKTEQAKDLIEKLINLKPDNRAYRKIRDEFEQKKNN